jgi:hypothetical protein
MDEDMDTECTKIRYWVTSEQGVAIGCWSSQFEFQTVNDYNSVTNLKYLCLTRLV